MAVTLVHDSPEQAKDNVVLLPRRVAAIGTIHLDGDWSDVVGEIEVRADGRVLLAKLRGSVTADWEIVALDESLLWHDGP